MIDLSTKSEYFLDWDSFTAAYYDVIREAMASLRFVPPDLVEDWTHSFFADKLIEKRFLENLPELRGPFRNWLFTMVKHHALDKLRQLHAQRQHEVVGTDVGALAEDPQPTAIPTIESDTMYALTYLGIALRMVRSHWERIEQGEKWWIFDALVLAPADPDSPHPTREQLLAELPGRDAQYLDNCVTTIKRSIRALLPRLLPAEMSACTTADERFAELKEILRDSPRTELRWLRWDVPVSWAKSSASSDLSTSMGRSGGLGEPDISSDEEEDSRELPDEFEHDRMRLEQRIHLALPFSAYLKGPQTSEAGGRSPTFWGRLGQAQKKDTLENLLAGLGYGTPTLEPTALVARMKELKQYGKRLHRRATRVLGRPTSPPPRELGHLLYTLASAVALVGAGEHIPSLDQDGLARNVAWALHRPWLDPRLRPILQQAQERLLPNVPDTN